MGVAWKALRYDRRAITILGQGQRVGRLARGVGREAELAVLARLWEEEGVFALHNDLTNCLRHGDLTIVRPRDDSVDVTIVEVKAGPRPEGSPQLERATSLLRDGRRIDDAGALQVTVVPQRYETYLGILPELIGRARDVGYGWARPHDCLLVGAVDYRVWGRRPDEFNARSDAERRGIGWSANEPETLGWTASLKRMRDRSVSFSSLAPYTIFPLSAEDISDVVLGFVDLALALHLPLLERTLNRNGIAVRVARAPEAERVFLEATRGSIGVRVPPHLREQMMVELMSPCCAPCCPRPCARDEREASRRGARLARCGVLRRDGHLAKPRNGPCPSSAWRVTSRRFVNLVGVRERNVARRPVRLWV
jgi:hypothetical protein